MKSEQRLQGQEHCGERGGRGKRTSVITPGAETELCSKCVRAELGMKPQRLRPEEVWQLFIPASQVPPARWVGCNQELCRDHWWGPTRA